MRCLGQRVTPCCHTTPHRTAAQVLVAFERHWTKSDKERTYAVAAFVSQMLNSVVVLLLVNAQVRGSGAAVPRCL